MNKVPKNLENIWFVLSFVFPKFVDTFFKSWKFSVNLTIVSIEYFTIFIKSVSSNGCEAKNGVCTLPNEIPYKFGENDDERNFFRSI